MIWRASKFSGKLVVSVGGVPSSDNVFTHTARRPTTIRCNTKRDSSSCGLERGMYHSMFRVRDSRNRGRHRAWAYKRAEFGEEHGKTS